MSVRMAGMLYASVDVYAFGHGVYASGDVVYVSLAICLCGSGDDVG